MKTKRTLDETLLIAVAELRAIADAMDIPEWAQRELLRVAKTLEASRDYMEYRNKNKHEDLQEAIWHIKRTFDVDEAYAKEYAASRRKNAGGKP